MLMLAWSGQSQLILGDGREHPGEVSSPSECWHIGTSNHSWSQYQVRVTGKPKFACLLDCGRELASLERTCKLAAQSWTKVLLAVGQHHYLLRRRVSPLIKFDFINFCIHICVSQSSAAVIVHMTIKKLT